MSDKEKDEYLHDFGDRLRKLRIEKGLTLQELADKCGYNSRSTIKRIELGENDVPQSKIQMLADALNVSPCVLMGWAGPENVDEIIDQHYGEDVTRHVHEYVKLDRDDRIYTDGIIGGLLANEKYSAKEGSSAGAAT